MKQSPLWHFAISLEDVAQTQARALAAISPDNCREGDAREALHAVLYGLERVADLVSSALYRDDSKAATTSVRPLEAAKG